MNDTFRPDPPMIAIAIATAPTPSAAIRATRISSCSESRSWRTTFDHTSWATAPEAEMTSPATTARIVANATAAMNASRTSPPTVPAPPPSAWASSGAARLPPLAGRLLARRAEHDAGAEAERRDHEVEGADQEHRPDDARARGLRVGHGEEAHEDVRQARRAEHEREAERHRVDRLGQEEPRLEVLLAVLRAGRGAVEQVDRVPADPVEHEDRQQGRAREQQPGLDDLHPGRGDHAAEDDVAEHEHAGDDDREREVDADERLDEHARADHLRDEVEGRDGERPEGRGGPRRALVEAERQDVGDRVAAGVAHPLGEQEQHGEERDEEADGVEHAVEAEQEDQAGDAEERRGRHVVAGDREAVLHAGDAAAGGPELRGRAACASTPST